MFGIFRTWQSDVVAILRDLAAPAHARKLPREVFEAICPLHKRVGVDLLVFNSKHEVWLVGRGTDPNDPFAGKYHVPGVMFGPAESVEQGIARLLRSEFPNVQFGELLNYPRIMDFPIDERGSSYVTITKFVVVTDESVIASLGKGKFFSVDKLPPNMVVVQIPQIREVYQSL